MTAETDERFIDRMEHDWVHDIIPNSDDAHRLFALARRGAAVQGAPAEPGGFVGDIFYGHPDETTLGTHRWDGSHWAALPSVEETLIKLLAEARAENKRLKAAVQWRPISEAPKDGTPIRLWRPAAEGGKWQQEVAAIWESEYEGWAWPDDPVVDIFGPRDWLEEGDCYTSKAFTHWMPIPPPPKGADE